MLLTLQRYPSNGVPWLVWRGARAWECEACGGSGRLPPFTDVAAFAGALGDLKRAHFGGGSDADRDCVGAPFRRDGDRVGDPLNPDRVEV